MANELTEKQIRLLSEDISVDVWISIALAELGLKQSKIDNLQKKHPGNNEAVSRELITRWKNKTFDDDEDGQVDEVKVKH